MLCYKTNHDRMLKVFDREMIEDIIVEYENAYEPPINESVLKGMRFLADNFEDKFTDNFLYWFWCVAILEGLVEDDEGYIDRDYIENKSALGEMLDLGSVKMSAPEALAYARIKLIGASSCILPQNHVVDSYQFIQNIHDKKDMWNMIEQASEECDNMWIAIGEFE